MAQNLTSSTRLVVLITLLSLVGMCFYLIHIQNWDIFKIVFAVLAGVTTTAVGHWIGKSTSDGATQATASSPVVPTPSAPVVPPTSTDTLPG